MTTYKFPSGKKQAEGEMVRGEMNGEWNFWSESVRIVKKEYYENGILQREETFWQAVNKVEASYLLCLLHLDSLIKLFLPHFFDLNCIIN